MARVEQAWDHGNCSLLVITRVCLCLCVCEGSSGHGECWTSVWCWESLSIVPLASSSGSSHSLHHLNGQLPIF